MKRNPPPPKKPARARLNPIVKEQRKRVAASKVKAPGQVDPAMRLAAELLREKKPNPPINPELVTPSWRVGIMICKYANGGCMCEDRRYARLCGGVRHIVTELLVIAREDDR